MYSFAWPRCFEKKSDVLLQTSPTERIDALELLGATFVDKKRDLLGALKYWKRAMDLRHVDSNNIVHKPEPKQLIMAYDYAREVRPFQPVLT